MRLLEIITGEKTRPDLTQKIMNFAEKQLGKGIVDCKDTPGFICNRIGVFWLQTAVREAIRLNLSIEEADALMSRPLGIPKTGVFGLIDLIGLDLMPQIINSMADKLADNDEFHHVKELPPVFLDLLEQGNLGRKSQAGFYRLNRLRELKLHESIDLKNGVYRTSEKANIKLDSRVNNNNLISLFERDDRYGNYAWSVVSSTINYTAGLIPEISDSPADIDRAMKLGYNWKYGPFELLDCIGATYLKKRRQHEGLAVTDMVNPDLTVYQTSEKGEFQYRTPLGSYKTIKVPPGVLSLDSAKKNHPPILHNATASLWDIGDHIVCFEFHGKMNTLSMQTMTLLQQSIALASEQFQAMVIYNDGQNFSAGANLEVLSLVIKQQNWQEVENILRIGQSTYQSLKYSPIPVIGAPFGMALGGGAEILLHCDAIQSHIELYMGLVELGVGLIPGWRGCTEMLLKCSETEDQQKKPIDCIKKIFESICHKQVSKSALEAMDLSYLRPSDKITMNRDRLLADAKSLAITMAADYRCPKPQKINLSAETLVALHKTVENQIACEKSSEYDHVLINHLLNVFCGGNHTQAIDVNQETLMTLERDAFLTLVRQPETVARIEHMMKTGRALNN